MQQDVSESLRAAEIYVRYCTSETEKASLLFTYLAERFPYQEGTSRTPVYSALCQGIADSKSMAQSWQLLCDEEDPGTAVPPDEEPAPPEEPQPPISDEQT